MECLPGHRRSSNVRLAIDQRASFVVSETLCYVGIKDGRIPNSAMTASSVWDDGYNAFYERLDNTGDPGGFWHPAGNKAVVL